MLILYY